MTTVRHDMESVGEIIGRLANEVKAREKSRPAEAGRWYRPLMFGLTIILLAIAATVGWLAWDKAAPLGRVGADLTLYLDATRSFLAGHGFYHPEQLAGPYTLVDGDILYPPVAILLFLPFLVLPGILWVLIPAGIVSVIVAHHRPAPWTWPLMALCLAYPPSMVFLVHANPVMWIAAFVALATLRGGWGVLVLLKPSLLPFALIGVNRRWWWITLGLVGVASIPFGALWLDWARALLNSGGGLLYSLPQVPLLLIPVLARAAMNDDRQRGKQLV